MTQERGFSAPLPFQGRPYTRPVPFSVTFSGTAGESHAVWLPKNAFFELVTCIAKSNNAVELILADTADGNVIGFIGLDGINFSVFPGAGSLAGIRSNNPTFAQLLLVDPVGVACIVHGVCLGWEVTREGMYRTGS